MRRVKVSDSPSLLDITRLISRLRKGAWTGIDRVEAQYLAHLKKDDFVSFRWKRWVICLKAEIAQNILLRARNRGRFARKQAQIWFTLNASARLSPKNFGRWARSKGIAKWLVVGHSHLKPDSFKSLAEADVVSRVLIHDVIPLDHPEFSGAGAGLFERRMQTVSRYAGEVFYPSRVSKTAAEHWFAKWGRVPPGEVVPLDIPLKNPPPYAPTGCTFVAISTVEPRKGYDHLVRLWDALGETAPELAVYGQPGWADPSLFTALREHPKIKWYEHASDNDVMAGLSRARALLFPTRAEGAGLPVAEALQMNVPVIATDLPVLRELYGDAVTYCKVDDITDWATAIKKRSEECNF